MKKKGGICGQDPQLVRLRGLILHHIGGRTNDKGLFGLRSMLIVPRGAGSGVDGARARAEQGRLCFTQ